MNTHHWVFQLELDNDYRNNKAGITFRWYGPLAVFFDAYVVGGRMPVRLNPDHLIRIQLGEKVVGTHRSKEEAFGQIKRLLENSPIPCRTDCVQHMDLFHKALFG